MNERDESVGALFVVCYPRNGFRATTPTLAPNSPNRHKEPDHRDAGERGVSDQARSGVMDLSAGLPTLGADSGFRSLELEGETLSSTVTGNYGVARKEDLIEVAGCEFLRKQIC